jgi:hypothetical protein
MIALASLSSLQAEAGSYSDLAQDLSAQISASNSVRVGVGEFVYADTLQQSAYSSLLREELETALAGTGQFEIITRDRIADLQLEADFQRKSFIEDSSEAKELKIAGVDGIVRGRFFYNYPDVTIFAELAWLENGKVNKAKVTIPVKDAGAQLFPQSQRLDEQMATSLLELAELAWADADYSQSAAWYQRFRSLSRQNARSLWLGVRLARLADDEDAEASYALQLRNLFPLSPEYLLLQESRGEEPRGEESRGEG